MERESFIFYRSFYEATRDLPDNIRLEALTAIIEYAIYSRVPPDLKPFAKGIFTLVKPILDANTARYNNGRKGGRRPRHAPQQAPRAPEGGEQAQPAPSPGHCGAIEISASPHAAPAPPGLSQGESQAGESSGESPCPSQSPLATFRAEAALLRADKIWSEPVCMQFSITLSELSRRLDQFAAHCASERPGSPHTSITDAKRHFKSWMTKAYKQTNDTTPQDKYTKRRGADSAALSPEDFTGEI